MDSGGPGVHRGGVGQVMEISHAQGLLLPLIRCLIVLFIPHGVETVVVVVRQVDST